MRPFAYVDDGREIWRCKCGREWDRDPMADDAEGVAYTTTYGEGPYCAACLVDDGLLRMPRHVDLLEEARQDWLYEYELGG